MTRSAATRKGGARRCSTPFVSGFLLGLAGWFMLYLTVGGAAGLLFSAAGDGAPSCIPKVAALGLLQANCDNGVVNLFWALTVGIPRALLALPAFAISVVASTIENGTFGMPPLTRLIQWLWVGVPVMALIGAGMAFWWRRSIPVAAIIVFFLPAAIVHIRSLLSTMPLPSS